MGKIVNRFCCFVLVVVLSLSGSGVVFASEDTSESVSSGITAKSDGSASGRVRAFISMAAGKRIINEDLDGLKLSEEDVRFLGVYVSNFYVPFHTELGSSKSESAKKSKENIQKALQTNLSFDNGLAENLTDMLINMSKSSSKELSFCLGESAYGVNLVPMTDVSLSYLSFMYAMSGGMDSYLYEKYIDSEDSMPTYALDVLANTPNAFKKDLSSGKTLEGKKYKYLYLAYQEGGNYKPVFSMGLYGAVTPSMSAFYKCLEAVDLEKGYGMSFWDFNKDEFNSSDLADSDIDTTDLVKMSVFGSSIRVDCFGNLILMGGNHQFIMLPGCMNPYSWVGVDENGEDIKSAGGALKLGFAYNILNIPSMIYADNNNLFSYSGRRDDEVFRKTTQAVQELSKGKVTTTSVQTVAKKIGISISSTSISGKSSKEIVEYFTKKVKSKYSSVSTAYGKLKVDGLWSKLNKIKVKGVDTTLINKNITGIDYKNTKNTAMSSYFRAERGSSKTAISKGGLLDSIKGLFKKSKVDVLLDGLGEGAKELKIDYVSYYKPSDESIFVPLINTKVTTTKNSVKSYDSISWKGTTQYYYDNMVFIDDLGAFHFNNKDEDLDFTTLNVASYIDGKGNSKGTYKDVKNGFVNTFQSIEDGDLALDNYSNEAVVALYTTYAYAGLYDDDSKKNTIGKLGYRMVGNGDVMPDLPSNLLDLSDAFAEQQNDIMLTRIRDWLYYLLHPTEGFKYTSKWLTGILNSFLVSWHNAMVGTEDVGVISGTTRYRNTTGYITTPDLSEISWTDSLIGAFSSTIPYLIICLLVIMLFVYISGTVTLQRAIVGVLIFAVAIALPVPLINGVVFLGNTTVSKLYGDKFSYWSMVQHQSYSSKIDEAATGSSYENYLRTLYSTNAEAKGNQGGESIMLKWQAPKKMSSLMFTSEDNTNTSGFLKNSLLTGALENTYSGEKYLSSDATYLYRSYLDISNFSRYIYRGLDSGVQSRATSISSSSVNNFSKEYQDVIKSIKSNYEKDRAEGYSNQTISGSKDFTKQLHTSVPLTSRIINDAVKKKGTVKNLKLGQYVGINQDYFEFSIPMFNTNLSYKDVLLSSSKSKNFSTELSKYNNKDISGLASYGLVSESVFYYLSWNLYDSGLSPDSAKTSGYKNLLLGSDNAGFFYNTEGNGGTKDFMDMRSLFTYVIPYLNECNDLVREWDDVYGIFTYLGVPTEEGRADDAEIKGNKELTQKYWHNLNVARLYNMYTPWVDIMYDCSYAKGENIEVFGEKVWIEDPINPASYPEERPMVFSRSEMQDYGLLEKDLTEVERRIVSCNDAMQKRMFNLLNYYTFNDVVLNTAAAMECTFEFNLTFSDSSAFNDNYSIYPQTYELTDFSYDAFLRFAIANNTGENMLAEGDFYQNVVNNSSTTAALVMVILDVLAVYVMPWGKLIFLTLVFISSILVLLISIFGVTDEKNAIIRVFNSIIKPMLYFLLITVGMAFIVSMFMGDGYTGITGMSSATIQMGDPVSMMLAMILVNALCIVLYFLVVRGVWSEMRKMGSTLKGFMSGVFSGVIGSISGLVGNSKNSGNGYSSGGVGSSSGSTRAHSRADRNMSSVQDVDFDNSSQEEEERREEYTRVTKSVTPGEESDGYENTINDTIERGKGRRESNEDESRRFENRSNRRVSED